MASTPARLTSGFSALMRYRGMLYPAAAASLVLVLLIPLPTAILDLLLIVNITLSALILLTVMYVNSPLELSAFPSLLLSMTLFRLVLNTATTRLILTHGHTGTAAAGHVIEEFAAFVASGSLAVGFIVFIIITVIQFVVITKGATRIAEVAARFTLDGMPGKQMSIDADLNAGLIKEDEARRRRETITREADFYGAMDGASKFVRGDAVAGIIITFVNILGGMYVGMVEHGVSVMQCLDVYTKLTIGDGLVTQIPSFLVSIAAGMIVTRSTARTNMGEELLGQLTSRPVAFGLSAGFLGLLALTPLPRTPIVALALGCSGMAFLLGRSGKRTAAAAEAKAKVETKKPERVEDNLSLDPVELEVGYGLIKLVDRKQNGDLLDRITNIRKQIATELGLVVPPIRIRDNVQLEPNHYVIKLRGVDIARGELLPGYLLAIDSGVVAEPVHGIDTREPAFGLPALWIAADQRGLAEQRGYTVVETSAVLATHLTEQLKAHAFELLTRQELNRLLDTLKERSPKIVDDLLPDVLKPSEVQRVLQQLLRERVSIRDLETILETLGDWAGRTKDAEVLTEYVRNALARAICQQWKADGNLLHAVTLDPAVEDLISGHLERTERGTYLTLPPQAANKIIASIRNEIEAAANKSGGKQPVLLASPQVRPFVRRLIENTLAGVPVLAYNEIVQGIEVKAHGMVVWQNETANV